MCVYIPSFVFYFFFPPSPHRMCQLFTIIKNKIEEIIDKIILSIISQWFLIIGIVIFW